MAFDLYENDRFKMISRSFDGVNVTFELKDTINGNIEKGVVPMLSTMQRAYNECCDLMLKKEK